MITNELAATASVAVATTRAPALENGAAFAGDLFQTDTL